MKASPLPRQPAPTAMLVTVVKLARTPIWSTTVWALGRSEDSTLAREFGDSEKPSLMIFLPHPQRCISVTDIGLAARVLRLQNQRTGCAP